MGAAEGEVGGLIERLVEREREEGERKKDGGAGGVREVVEGMGVFVGCGGGGVAVEEGDGACVVVLGEKVTERGGWVKGRGRLEVGLGKGKAASRALRDALPEICEFVARYLRAEDAGGDGKKVVVLCESGKDLSVGVALAVYCWCFDDTGNVRQDDKEVSFNKTAIRVRLGHIVTTLPEANPSRATLQSVNSFLMDWRK